MFLLIYVLLWGSSPLHSTRNLTCSTSCWHNPCILINLLCLSFCPEVQLNLCCLLTGHSGFFIKPMTIAHLYTSCKYSAKFSPFCVIEGKGLTLIYLHSKPVLPFKKKIFLDLKIFSWINYLSFWVNQPYQLYISFVNLFFWNW